MERSDRELVERTLTGDTTAFAELHKRYYARIYRQALYRARNTQDAEDIASETFVRAIAHLGSYRFQGESLYPWLARIATNLIADQGRRSAAVTLISLEGTEESLRSYIESLPGNQLDPHALAERGETQAMLRAAIATLPPDQAEAVLLRFGGDLSLKEIAASLGKTEGAIKSLLHRGLHNLRRSVIQVEAEALQWNQTRITSTGLSERRQTRTDTTAEERRETRKEKRPSGELF